LYGAHSEPNTQREHAEGESEVFFLIIVCHDWDVLI
jgi:hypothetical protein